MEAPVPAELPVTAPAGEDTGTDHAKVAPACGDERGIAVLDPEQIPVTVTGFNVGFAYVV